MGKAFTESERAAVLVKLRRTGLRLFAEKGIRGVSIRDLTAAAGIAQGGFYTFYADKDDFLADLFELRIREKLDELRKESRASQVDPPVFLTELFYREGMHLRGNRVFDNLESGTLAFYFDQGDSLHKRAASLYRAFLEELAELWRAGGYTVQMDMDGLINLIRSAGILITNARMLDESYFNRIYRLHCENGVRAFLKTEKPL
ncbi:MAG: TetR/AcrR family transcriptional regulator [Clostridia bacterium]|nr:TetR/AcrR family transcriptional regulator [Clostridia bacterium]